MRKLFYLLAAGCLGMTAVSCGNKTATTDTDTTTADTVAVEAVADSAATDTDTAVAPVAEAEPAAEKPAENANAAKIDKLLKQYSSLVGDVRSSCYVDGQFFYGTILRDLMPDVIDTKDKLKALEGDMTAEQKAKFDKLTNSIKEAL